MRTSGDDAVDRLVELLGARDRSGALELVRSLRSGGVTADALISGILGPAQRRVGELWQHDVWNVVQEHIATGIVDAALAELELSIDTMQLRGDVVLGCVEGEWHALPARMLAEQLRHQGWAVTFVGASVPASDIERFVRALRPMAVVVSCSVSVHLGGARRTVDAAHRCGLPVLAGGAGFGEDARRSVAVGADAWALTAAAAAEVLAGWSVHTPELASASSSGADIALASVHHEVVDRALAKHIDVRAEDLDHLRADLEVIMRFAEAALLTDDPSVLDDHVRWLRVASAARQRRPELVDASLAALAASLPADQSGARALLDGSDTRSDR